MIKPPNFSASDGLVLAVLIVKHKPIGVISSDCYEKQEKKNKIVFNLYENSWILLFD